MARYTRTGSVNTVPAINAELEKIENAFKDIVSRKGDVPNTMEAPLDMNSERILNLPEPVSGLEPIRLQDFNALIQDLIFDNVEDSGSNTYREVLADGQQTVVSPIAIGEALVFLTSETGDSGLLVPEQDYEFAGNTLTLFSAYPDATITITRIKRSFDFSSSSSQELPFIYAKDEGVLGSVSADSLINEQDALQAALNKAVSEDKVLVLQGGRHYLVDSLGVVTDDAINTGVVAIGGAPAYLHKEKDSSGATLRLEPEGNPIEGLTLESSIQAGDAIFTLNDTSQLKPGMTIQFSSDEEWPYDGRGQWFKGDILTIDRILDGTRIETVSRSYDEYDLGSENITVQAWTPSKVVLQNLEIYQDIRETESSTVCCTVTKTDGALIDKVTVRDSASIGLFLVRAVNTALTNFSAYNHARSGTLGYGCYVHSCLNTYINNIRGHACRRLIDLNSRTGTDSAPTRRTIMRDIFYSGGGVETFASVPFWPEGEVSTDAVGMHGPCEDTLIVGGTIEDCFTGVTVRGRNTRIRDLEFSGAMKDCIGYSYGTGLDVQGCTVSNGKLPDRADSPSRNPLTFLRIGNSSSIFGGVDYTLPVTVMNNVCVGLKESFIKFNSPSDVKNLHEKNNIVLARPEDSETFYYLYAPFDTVDISSSTLEGSATPDYLRMSGSGSIGIDTNVTFGRSLSVNSAVKVADSTWIVYIADDDAVQIRPSQYLEGSSTSVTIAGTGDTSVMGSFIILPNNATLISTGYVGSNLEASAGGLSGTSGADTKLNVHFSTTGTLSLENRRGSPLTLKITVEG